MIRYFINEEKRIVTAVIDKCREDAIAIIVKRHPHMASIRYRAEISISDNLEDDCESDDNYCSFGDNYGYGLDKALISNVYKGTVKCDPRDTFDAEVGKKLAAAKANKHRRAAIERAIKRWKDNQLSIINNI